MKDTNLKKQYRQFVAAKKALMLAIAQASTEELKSMLKDSECGEIDNIIENELEDR